MYMLYKRVVLLELHTSNISMVFRCKMLSWGRREEFVVSWLFGGGREGIIYRLYMGHLMSFFVSSSCQVVLRTHPVTLTTPIIESLSGATNVFFMTSGGGLLSFSVLYL